MTLERHPPLEVRLEGRTLSGAAIYYGEVARDRREMFEAGAFAPIGPVAMNLQHDRSGLREIATTDGGSLRIDDRPDALRVEADLREGSAELSLVRRRALRGLSVEFRARAETRNPAGVRVIDRAELVGIGLVDSGSYRSNIEVRQMSDAWFTARVSYGRALQCECVGRSDCNTIVIDAGSVRLGDEMLAINGPATRVLGSRRRGTLMVEDTDDELVVGLVGNENTTLAREVKDQARAAPLYARPLIDETDSTYVDEGPIRRYTRTSIRGLLIKATAADRGHRPAQVQGVETRRRRLWL